MTIHRSRFTSYVVALTLGLGVVIGPSTRAEARRLSKAQAAAEEAATRRSAELAKALEKARTERAGMVAQASARADEGEVEAAATRLAEVAVEFDDPALAVEAAELYLRVPRGAAADKAQAIAQNTRALLAELPDPLLDPALDVRAVRIAGEEVPALVARCEVVERRAAVALRTRSRLALRGRREVRTGAVMTSLGVAGLGVLLGGVAVAHDRTQKLAAVSGRESLYDLSSLDAQGDRASTMLTVGALTSAVGLTIGAVLLAVGIREVRDNTRRARRAAFRVSPTPGGLYMVGRF
jgi:hypothetical protein